MIRLGYELQAGLLTIDDIGVPFTLGSIWSDDQAPTVLTLHWLSTISTLLGVLLTVLITGELVVLRKVGRRATQNFTTKSIESRTR